RGAGGGAARRGRARGGRRGGEPGRADAVLHRHEPVHGPRRPGTRVRAEVGAAEVVPEDAAGLRVVRSDAAGAVARPGRRVHLLELHVVADEEELQLLAEGARLPGGAHGGGDILSFLGMIVSGFMTSKGPPKPCFWRGEQVDLPSSPPAVRFDGGPGSRPDVDGSAVLPPEVFVSLRRYGSEDGVETSLGEDDSRALASAAGLRFSQVLRRDQEPDDGAGAALLSVWDSRADYEASAVAEAAAPPRGEALYEGVLVLERGA
ncbi:unnamed protein product, partial [Prorocentrum cordatum]